MNVVQTFVCVFSAKFLSFALAQTFSPCLTFNFFPILVPIFLTKKKAHFFIEQQKCKGREKHDWLLFFRKWNLVYRFFQKITFPVK